MILITIQYAKNVIPGTVAELMSCICQMLFPVSLPTERIHFLVSLVVHVTGLTKGTWAEVNHFQDLSTPSSRTLEATVRYSKWYRFPVNNVH